MTDAELAAQLATTAGDVLLSIRRSPVLGGDVLGGDALGRIGDAVANEFLCRAIAHHRPDDGLLSEENADTPARLSMSRVWIVDPVDGTREYGAGRDDWAVHVALAIDGVPAIGAVALPSRGLTLRSDAPPPLRAASSRLRIAVSRTRPPVEAQSVADALGADLVAMGSAGAKAMAVVLGEAAVYLHSGGQSEWDSCAPVAVARAAGLHASRLDGSPLSYNRRDTALPDLLICRAELAPRILDLLASG